ncbi:DUF5412 family protein [Ureibacillus sp. MALMAid1270]|uniref:DUF5412 family protein n=1 Tax=Ureibacillus sp. MALMAid1270 TaxID=3411629 RepID=UPI003BA82726
MQPLYSSERINDKCVKRSEKLCKKGRINILTLLGILIAFISVILLLIFSVTLLISIIKKKPFPKKLFIATITGLGMVCIIYIYENYFFTFDSINQEYTQPGPGPLPSPTERYTAHAYYEPYGGAAGGVNVWVELTDHLNNDKKKIIYYADVKRSFSMFWTDEKTLFIRNVEHYDNKSITLNVEKEIYHESGLACKSWVMKNEYVTCYKGKEGNEN